MTGLWHLAFPLRLDGAGRSVTASAQEYVRGLVETVLFTRPGERVNRPEFGSGLDALVFAPAGDELAQATQALVHGALQRWLGDLIRVEAVTVTAVETTVTVVVSFRALAAGATPGAPEVLTVTGPAGSAP